MHITHSCKIIRQRAIIYHLCTHSYHHPKGLCNADTRTGIFRKKMNTSRSRLSLNQSASCPTSPRHGLRSHSTTSSLQQLNECSMQSSSMMGLHRSASTISALRTRNSPSGLHAYTGTCIYPATLGHSWSLLGNGNARALITIWLQIVFVLFWFGGQCYCLMGKRWIGPTIGQCIACWLEHSMRQGFGHLPGMLTAQAESQLFGNARSTQHRCHQQNADHKFIDHIAERTIEKISTKYATGNCDWCSSLHSRSGGKLLNNGLTGTQSMHIIFLQTGKSKEIAQIMQNHHIDGCNTNAISTNRY